MNNQLITPPLSTYQTNRINTHLLSQLSIQFMVARLDVAFGRARVRVRRARKYSAEREGYAAEQYTNKQQDANKCAPPISAVLPGARH